MEAIVEKLLKKYGDPTLKRVKKDVKVFVLSNRYGLHTCEMHKLVANKLAKLSVANREQIRDIGSYNIRRKRNNPNEWSVHSWAAAIDINSSDNGMGATKLQLIKNKFFLPDNFIEEMESLGFEAGARWKSPDRMHFQLKDVN